MCKDGRLFYIDNNTATTQRQPPSPSSRLPQRPPPQQGAAVANTSTTSTSSWLLPNQSPQSASRSLFSAAAFLNMNDSSYHPEQQQQRLQRQQVLDHQRRHQRGYPHGSRGTASDLDDIELQPLHYRLPPGVHGQRPLARRQQQQPSPPSMYSRPHYSDMATLSRGPPQRLHSHFNEAGGAAAVSHASVVDSLESSLAPLTSSQHHSGSAVHMPAMHNSSSNVGNDHSVQRFHNGTSRAFAGAAGSRPSHGLQRHMSGLLSPLRPAAGDESISTSFSSSGRSSSNNISGVVSGNDGGDNGSARRVLEAFEREPSMHDIQAFQEQQQQRRQHASRDDGQRHPPPLPGPGAALPFSPLRQLVQAYDDMRGDGNLGAVHDIFGATPSPLNGRGSIPPATVQGHLLPRVLW